MTLNRIWETTSLQNHVVVDSVYVSSMFMVEQLLVSKKENFVKARSANSCRPPLHRSPRRPWQKNPGPREPRSCSLWDIAPCGGISDSACCIQIQTDLSLGLPCRYPGKCKYQAGSVEGSSSSCVGTRHPSLSQRPCMQLLQCTLGCGLPEVADHSLLLHPGS